MVLLTGLSSRSLWGQEGRWGLIVKEMLASGDYFMPTANGVLDWDKPLLSFWAILPFASQGTLSEAVLRIPSALAGTGTTLLVYLMGRSLFGSPTGSVSALICLTSTMFIFWSRTASAELMNVFSIWLMLWIFLAGAGTGRFPHVIAFYLVGAVACFVKGPVAPVVSISAVSTYSLFRVLTALREANPSGKWPAWRAVRASFFSQCPWILSRQGLVGILAGAGLFWVILLLTVYRAGSWAPASLMWKENVVRYFFPFDHEDPFYAYLLYIPLYAAPWTFFMISSLWNGRFFRTSRAAEFIYLVGLGILLFFLLSGSRRSYYILPLIPALSIITGQGISRWLEGVSPSEKDLLRLSCLATAVLVACAGLGLLGIHIYFDVYRHISLPIMGIATVAGAYWSFLFIRQERRGRGFFLLIITVFVLQFWIFTQGMAIAERGRTLRTFALHTAGALQGVDKSSIVIYQHGTASLLFYLGLGTLRSVDTPQALMRFAAENPEGLVIIDLQEFSPRHEPEPVMGRMIPIVLQETAHDERAERFALLACSLKALARHWPEGPPGTSHYQPGQAAMQPEDRHRKTMLEDPSAASPLL